MGYFSELAIDIVDLYAKDGLKEAEIAKIVGCSVDEVHDVLAAYEDSDQSVYDGDVDDGQPTMYEEYQDLYGGDDWDHGQYDSGEY